MNETEMKMSDLLYYAADQMIAIKEYVEASDLKEHEARIELLYQLAEDVIFREGTLLDIQVGYNHYVKERASQQLQKTKK